MVMVVLLLVSRIVLMSMIVLLLVSRMTTTVEHGFLFCW